MSARAAQVFVTTLLSLGCGAIAAAQTAPQADFTVHEWGLVSFDPDRPAEVLTSQFDDSRVFSDPFPGMAVPEKPIVYVHPGPTFDFSQAINVSVRIERGTVFEAWPSLTPSANLTDLSTFEWTLQVLDHGCDASVAPIVSDPHCAAIPPGYVCEAAELPRYIADTPYCLQVDNMQVPVLLWNGITEWRPPVSAVPQASGAIEVSNTSTATVHDVFVALGPGVAYVDQIPAGETVTVSADMATLNTATLQASVHQILIDGGMTINEADDFVRAWNRDVLSVPSDAWQVLGFYAPETIDALAPLTITPQPTAVHRVLAFAAP